MSREAWALIKDNKNFNVNMFRRGLTILILSLVINCFLGLLMFYIYLNEPERDYYATSGITPPVKLQSRLTPNESPQALLEPDPAPDEETRVIPQ